MKHMIDEPTVFDSLDVWRAYLAELQSIKNPDVEIRAAIQRAVQHIKGRQSPR